MVRDFTQHMYSQLLDALLEAGYQFQTFHEYLLSPGERVVILRHDVDKKPINSQQFAMIEHDKKLKASYFFRVVQESFNPEILQKIANLGHEIGYHYEDMDFAKGDLDVAIKLFEKHLTRLRKLAKIDTICMHGSPLSKFDNKDVWKKYSYRDYGILGEPYFDLDYTQIFYITDTGRKWNNKDASLRDKVDTPFDIKVTSTARFIELIREGSLPERIMINTHPQRWNNFVLSWVVELVGQSVKNQVKKILSHRSHRKHRFK